MSETFEQKLRQFREYVKKMKSYEEAIGVLYWDLRTGAPKKGVESRSAVIGTLSAELFKMAVSDQMGEYLDYFSSPDHEQKLDRVNRKIVAECKKEYDRNKKIPPEKYEAYVVLTAQSASVWEEAREKSDFSLFRPYLEKIVAANLEFVDLWGYEGHKYNTFLDMYEPGMTVGELDRVFAELRDRLVPLLANVRQSPHQPDTSFLRGTFDKERQKQFSLFILRDLGYDFEAGRLDESAHPFATGLNPGDVRITTRYLPDDVTSALFGTIHEFGHALYEQNIAKDLFGTPLCTGTSMGIHESQSRLWENMIGRSRAFWTRYYGDLQKLFPETLSDVPLERFYKAINAAKPSLIRVEADELTYNLHIMIRYEIEKALLEETVRVADLPEFWNEKYRAYLGVTPSNDAEGVLQDIHWSEGLFGYFPSYSLGNMYAAQLDHAMREQISDLDGLVQAGDFAPIREWLSERVHRHGKLLTPSEIIVQAAGEPLNPAYLVRYLETKYADIYALSR